MIYTHPFLIWNFSAIIVAPDVEAASMPGSLDEQVATVIAMAHETEIPVIFSMNKRRLGRSVGKRIRVSVIGILSYDGVAQSFHDMLNLHRQLKDKQLVVGARAEQLNDVDRSSEKTEGVTKES